jgi:hypothetical protein
MSGQRGMKSRRAESPLMRTRLVARAYAYHLLGAIESPGLDDWLEANGLAPDAASPEAFKEIERIQRRINYGPAIHIRAPSGAGNPGGKQ